MLVSSESRRRMSGVLLVLRDSQEDLGRYEVERPECIIFLLG
jgi:hypothetical protein